MESMATVDLERTDSPHQPKRFCFPARSFGNKGEKRSFKPAWFDTWSRLDYREVSDSVLCYYCSRANDRNLLCRGLYGKREDTFLINGLVNWKDARASFRRHETSKYHVQAVQVISKPQQDVGEILSQAHSEQKKLNSCMLSTILQNLTFLGRQGLALGGTMMTKAILFSS